ncbi:MAG: hypothetical protein HZC37_08640 [Burkholderiales bacterium]|nr:hypothetical protein [Burkholderiales bacterium]
MDGTLTGSAAAGEPRTVDAGRGVAWWGEAWALFTKAAGLWIVLTILLIVIAVVLSFIPLLGGLALALLMPVFIGSLMLAARKVEGGGSLEVGDLFTCFKDDKLTPLLVVGGLLLACVIVISLVVGALGLGALFGVAAGGAAGSAGGIFAALGAGLMALLVGFLLGVLVSMATWFAPPLVVFGNRAPVDAIKASFAASLKNVVPFLLWGLIYIVAAIAASIPFGLGWIVLAPVLLLTVYVSYKDIFGG